MAKTQTAAKVVKKTSAKPSAKDAPTKEKTAAKVVKKPAANETVASSSRGTGGDGNTWQRIQGWEYKGPYGVSQLMWWYSK